MRFSKTIKRIIALGTGATMMGATLLGAMAAADLGNYPAPFIKDGKFTGVMVIGDKAAAEDVIGVSDIAVSLQFSATQAAGTVSTDVSIEGEAWKVGTATNTLEMSENKDSGTAVRETIADITSQSYIDDGDMSTTLADGTASNSKGDASYNQKLYFEETDTGYVFYTENDDDVTTDFMYFGNNKQIARYELEFTTSLESDVDDSTGTATTTGTYLTDIEDVEIVLLGKTYTVVQARRNAAVGGGVKLILMGGAIKDTLLEGETKTYTVDGKDYETTLDYVDADEAKFTVNGESTRKLKDGDTDKLSDDTEVGISEILYQDYAGGIHSATFFLGAQKMELKDLDIETSTAASDTELKVGDETIDGAAVFMEGTDDNTTFKLDKIIVNMTADDDYYVPAGEKLSENSDLSEPELVFTNNWDIEYLGLTTEDLNEIKVNPQGSDDYVVEFTDGSGNAAKFPLVNVPAASSLKFGDDDDDLIVQENKTITKDDYFIIVNENENDGERSSYALRYRGADKSTADSPVIKFDDLGSGERIERPYSVGSTEFGGGPAVNVGPHGEGITEIGQIKLGGTTFRIFNVTTTTSKDYEILVDLDASNSHTSERTALNTKYGARIDIINESANGVTFNVSTPNTDHYDNKAPTAMAFNITGDSNTEGQMGEIANAAHNFKWKTPEDEENTQYTYTALGAKAKWDNPSGDPDTLTIWYPKTQVTPLVYVTGKGATVSSTTAASGEAVVVNRIEVGATKLASEVPDVKAVNAILVGGPCANAAAAEIMGDPADCTAGFEAGKGLIQLFENDGNVAMLVAGYAAADTRAAAKVVSNHGDYALTGAKMEVTTATSTVTEAIEAPVEEEVTEEEAEA